MSFKLVWNRWRSEWKIQKTYKSNHGFHGESQKTGLAAAAQTFWYFYKASSPRLFSLPHFSLIHNEQVQMQTCVTTKAELLTPVLLLSYLTQVHHLRQISQKRYKQFSGGHVMQRFSMFGSDKRRIWLLWSVSGIDLRLPRWLQPSSC